ncbi:MAG: aminomethyl-transferring glycine dehydrogenase subunit GcvPA [Nitrospinae bacterium]|nr:aminomethyl-transferring glycine dehydrogenase subunit GcvPA [Nitrospinota bacterium]
MRYIPLTPEDRKAMLSAIGVASVEDLFHQIPQNIRLDRAYDLPSAMPEQQLLRHAKDLARQNRPAAATASFLGAGAYNHFVPSAVDQLIGRSEFYTAYTPYQPEISQGTLQAIYEYQSYVCALFNMEVANASMYDGASALAEAVLMACRIEKKDEVVLSNLVHPRWRQVVKTYTANRGLKLRESVDHKAGYADAKALAGLVTDRTAAIVVQSPNFFGNVEDLAAIADVCREKEVLFVVGVAEAMSLGLLRPPGDFGADIVVADGQSLGLGLSFGGPYLGMFATRDRHMRQMPGRICGKTVDHDGKRGFVLTLSAREQHIRREKATSNICSNQALCALTVSIYLSLMGRQGFTETAKNCFYAAAALKERIAASRRGTKASFDLPFFNEFLVDLANPAEMLNRRLMEKGMIGGYNIGRDYPDMKNKMLLAVTELTTQQDMDRLMEVLGA